MSTYDADDLLSDHSLDAAVSALASRNAHHLQDMTPAEQQEAAGHWRALAMDVLVAVRATVTNPETAAGGAASEGGPGRAVIVLEDSGEEEINVHVAFHPELQQLGGDQVAGTPAQITAVSMIDTLGDDEQPPAG